MKQKFLMLFFAAGTLLCCPDSTHAQFGKLKEKLTGKKNEESGPAEANAKSAGNNKYDKRTFLGDPLKDPVLNEDFKYSDEQKDEDGIGGYYYAYWPFTGKVEKVWVRYNNWKYRDQTGYEKFSDDRSAAISVYSKDLSDYDSENYVAYNFLDYPAFRLMLEKTGTIVRTGDFSIFCSLKKGLMVFNFPAKHYKNSDPNDPLIFEFHLDTLAKYGKKSQEKYRWDLEKLEKVIKNEKTSQFVIVAKNREDLAGLNNYDTLKQHIIETALKDRMMYNNFKMAVREKPKATKTGELYTQTKWYNLAKEGMKKSSNLAAGETVLYGFAVENMRWETVKNPSGVPLYQFTNYYFVCKRNPNRQNKSLSDYFLLPAVVKRQYTGGGNYGDVFFDGASFGSIDITKEEAEAYKAFEPK